MNERELALHILMDITQGESYNNTALRKNLGRYGILTPLQKRFVTELVNGTLRNLIYIDYMIDSFSKTPVKSMKPVISHILRTAVYQIYYMDRTPDSAACNEAVKLARKKGFTSLTGFVNGVLRNLSRNKGAIVFPDPKKEPVSYLSVRYSHPQWLVSYWLNSYVETGVISWENLESLCQTNCRPPELTVCTNTLKTTPAQLKQKLIEEGMEVSPGRRFPEALLVSETADLRQSPSFQAGLFHVMDEGAMAAVTALDPKPGQMIADPCAAPGGKSFFSAYRMENRGQIWSGDQYPHKIELLNSGAERLGLSIIRPCLWDATDCRSLDVELKGKLDGIILDVPCSGYGLIRKKPDMKYTRTMEDVIALADLQRRILDACQAYVKPGGSLVYSTCTLSRLENEENADWFASRYDFEPASRQQLWPQTDGCDGFFIAKFIRSGK